MPWCPRTWLAPLLWRSLSKLPAGAVALDHAQAVGQLDASGEGSAEDSEGGRVVAAHQQQVFVAAALCLGCEMQLRTVFGADLCQVGGEADRGDLVRHAVHPHRALAAAGGIVDALHEVERQRLS